MGPADWSKRCQHYIMIVDDSVGGMRPDPDLKVCNLEKGHEGSHRREVENIEPGTDRRRTLVVEWMIKEEET